MLEVAFVVWLTYKLAGEAAGRGRARLWGGLGALFWIAGEALGFAVGHVAGARRGAGLAGFVCAAAGALAAYAVVRSLARRS